jgi:hypothetical protein
VKLHVKQKTIKASRRTTLHIVSNLAFGIVYLRGLMVIVPGYRSRGPGSIPVATRFSEK